MSTDEKHRALANRFIAMMNAAAAEGHPIDFVASAALAATGAYTAFNLSDGFKHPVASCALVKVTRQFEARVLDMARENVAPAAGRKH